MLRSELANALIGESGLSQATLYRRFQHLADKKLVVANGPSRRSYYSLTDLGVAALSAGGRYDKDGVDDQAAVDHPAGDTGGAGSFPGRGLV